MYPVVERFGEVIHDLTIEEIGVACMGFFKTENSISNVDVVDSIITKLIKNAEVVHEITLASIMKVIYLYSCILLGNTGASSLPHHLFPLELRLEEEAKSGDPLNLPSFNA